MKKATDKKATAQHLGKKAIASRQMVSQKTIDPGRSKKKGYIRIKKKM